jgi:curved DNA-binding protein CbpA
MMVINAAYKVLRDPSTRKKYDRERVGRSGKDSVTSAASTTNVQPSSSGPRARHEEADAGPVDSLASILSDLLKDILENGGEKVVGDIFSSLDKLVSLWMVHCVAVRSEVI